MKARSSTVGFRTLRLAASGTLVFALGAGLAACSSSSTSSTKTTVSPTSPQGLLSLGIAASKAGNIDQARNYFGKSIAANPKNTGNLQAIAYYNLGVVNQNNGRVPVAVIDYRNAVKLDPTFASAWYNLAIALTKSNPTEALAADNKILSIKPNDANSLFNSGLIMYGQGDTAGGVARIKQAIAINSALSSRVPANIILN